MYVSVAAMSHFRCQFCYAYRLCVCVHVVDETMPHHLLVSDSLGN